MNWTKLPTDTAAILRDLARARAEAQRQALLAALKQPAPKETKR